MPDADEGGRAAAPAQPARGVQRAALAEAKKGFVLLPRRWVVERSFGWVARFRCLSRDFERMPHVLVLSVPHIFRKGIKGLLG